MSYVGEKEKTFQEEATECTKGLWQEGNTK